MGDHLAAEEKSALRKEVEKAKNRLDEIVFRTRVFRSRHFDRQSGCVTFLKSENMQRSGSIRFRGILNKIKVELEKREVKRVIAYGSDDVVLAAALSGNILGLRTLALVTENVMPETSSALGEYQADIRSFSSAYQSSADLQNALQITSEDLLLSPAEDIQTAAGEATALYELLEDIPDLEILVIPSAEHRVLLCADAVAGESRKVFGANGILGSQSSAEPLKMLQTTEDERVVTQLFFLQRLKMLVRPESCSAAAAVLSNYPVFAGKKVGVILGSGNVDMKGLANVLQKSKAVSHPKMKALEYMIECYNCGATYNASEAVWCNCLTTDRTLICPRCMKCFCNASNSYKQVFWEKAPQDLWNKFIELQSKPERDLQIPFVWDVRRPLVLIVEPDLTVRQMARRIIENLGYGAILAEDGKEGLSLAKKYKPDFVLTAALMPKLDGREMSRLIKENRETAHIKIAIMTSLYTQQKYRSEAFKRFHVDEYLSKPLNVNTLQNLLHKYLDISEPLQS